MSYQVMDERFMLNKEPLEGAADALGSANVVVFTTMGATEARRKYGVGAQSIAEALPQAVWVDGLGMHHVDNDALVPVLVQAVKELSVRVAKLEGGKRRVTKSKPVEPAESATEPVAEEAAPVEVVQTE